LGTAVNLLRRLPRALVAVGVVLCLPAAAFGAGPAPVTADENTTQVTFGVQPADGKGPDGRPNFSWGATPGATLKDRVALVNYAPEPLPLTVYPTDAINTDDGGYGLLPGDREPSDVGSWITLKGFPKTVVIPAATKTAPGIYEGAIEVQVPSNASPGDHSGGIVAVLTSVDTSGEGPNVKLEQRVASRVFTRVAGDAVPELSVKNLSGVYHQSWNPFAPGSATVTYKVRNTGNLNLATDQLVQVLGPILDADTVKPPPLPLILPGSSIAVTAEFDRVWPQIWMHADVTLGPADPEGGIVGKRYPTVTASAQFWAIPWIWIIILVALLAVGGYLWYRSRRKSRQPPDRRGRHQRVKVPA
jgi:hypothetical protein